MIQDGWKEMSHEHQKEWMNASDSVKEKILAQRQSKSSGPPTKNHQLPTNGRTVYKLDFEMDGDGYYSDCTANSEATFDFNASSAVVYNTTGDNDSDGESVLEGQELIGNAAAAATKSQPQSILKVKGKGGRKKKRIFRASEMPAGAVSKMIANEQFRLMKKDNKVLFYWTANVSMAVMDYSRCDSLLPTPIEAPPPVDLHYKVHLLHQHEVDYRASMSKQDRVVGGRHLALVDSGTHGSIIG